MDDEPAQSQTTIGESATSVALSPGWYPDLVTGAPGTLRYWDGTRWTDQTATTVGKTRVTKARGVSRRLVVVVLVVLIAVGSGGAGVGVWNMRVAANDLERISDLEQEVTRLEEVAAALDEK